MDAHDPDRTVKPSSLEALSRLLEGNRRFAGGRPARPHTDAARRAELREGQWPFAAVVACADSRVPVEIVFDQGLGDVFPVRVAGNVASRIVIGSVEFAVDLLEVDVVAVLGHKGCGAVRAAIDEVEASPAIDAVLRKIEPAVREARERGGPLWETAVRIHAVRVAEALTERSEILRRRVEAGDLLVVPLVYDLETGRVERLDGSFSPLPPA